MSECILKIGVLGLNHKTADLSFLESIAKGAGILAGEKALFFPYPTVLLSTCNRTEIYFGAEDLSIAHSELLQLLRRHISEAFEHRLYSYFGLDCFLHLARVTAGLDSAIIGETEIQRQVKVSYLQACEFFHLPSCIHFVFQKALKLGKFVRTQLPFHCNGPSIFQAIWHLASEALGDLIKRRILFVGNSETNRKCIAFFTQKGVRSYSLITQTPKSVTVPNCMVYDRSELEHWSKYDLIICATSSAEYLLSIGGEERQVIFDLSVPRNVDPSLKSRVTLYNIEEVNRWIADRRSMREDLFTQAQELVWQETIALARGYRQKMLKTAALAGV